RRPRRRAVRLPRLRRQPRRPAAAGDRRPPARHQSRLQVVEGGAAAALAGRDVGAGGLMQALTYRPSAARYLVAPGSALSLEDIRPPRLPGPDWVMVRPRLSGICGSDQALLSGKASLHLAALTSTPFVPGHEVVGIADGRRVVLQPALGC